MMKRQRQSAILDLVDHEAIVSQDALRRRLERKGFSVTQATLSRDLKDLGLVKGLANGAYHRPGAEPAAPELASARLRHAVQEHLTGVDHAGQLVVAKTGTAQAQPLAAALDTGAARAYALLLFGLSGERHGFDPDADAIANAEPHQRWQVAAAVCDQRRPAGAWWVAGRADTQHQASSA